MCVLCPTRGVAFSRRRSTSRTAEVERAAAAATAARDELRAARASHVQQPPLPPTAAAKELNLVRAAAASEHAMLRQEIARLKKAGPGEFRTSAGACVLTTCVSHTSSFVAVSVVAARVCYARVELCSLVTPTHPCRLDGMHFFCKNLALAAPLSNTRAQTHVHRLSTRGCLLVFPLYCCVSSLSSSGKGTPRRPFTGTTTPRPREPVGYA